jgi:hypothetical protein
MESQRKFLSTPTHRIRFAYTPKHGSWMNQIEVGFITLARRLLRRTSFASLDELMERIRRFIDYFNETLAKPFRWTFTGISPEPSNQHFRRRVLAGSIGWPVPGSTTCPSEPHRQRS